MKFSKTIIAAIVLAVTTGCSAIETNNSKASESNIATHKVLKQANISFSKDKVYEFTYASIVPGMEAQLFGDYFPKALPLAGKYGGKSVGMFAVPGVKDGRKQAQIVAVFEWPSVDAWLQLHQDKEFLEIVPIRDEALAFGNPGNFYTVSEDYEATFTEGKMYELANYNLQQDDDGWSSKKSVFDQFIKDEKRVASHQGAQQELVFKPVPLSSHVQGEIKILCGSHNGYATDDNGLTPHLTILREWHNFNEYDSFQHTASLKQTNKLKRESVAHEYTLKTVFAFPAG